MKRFMQWLDDRTFQRRTIIRYTFLYLKARWKNGFKGPTILFYPDVPRVWNVIYLVCKVLGYRITNDPDAHFDMAMAFQDITVRPENKTLAELSKRREVLNGRCGDISKARVDRIFLETFGYGLTIDPRTHRGSYVKKTDTNALHIATIEAAPAEPENGFVYQKLIDNKGDSDTTTDIRTFIFDDTIPFTLYRNHDINDRFGDETIVAARVDANKAFSKEEQAQIIRFCKNFGLDYGELDILRDKNDGRIYIVDVNNTPSGPHPGVHMSKADYGRFVAELAAAFEKMVRNAIDKNSSHIPAV
ncbi:MAG TPA: hypothetical protein VMA75_02880 [Candidatus Paceibacterota bacterium]|nr:hypothetical protein [Candidatus Paceibacterota bacterium]